MVKVILELVEYRDAGMMTFTYFWTLNSKHVGPFFNSEIEAKDWLTKRLTIDIAV
jgi:hypothetical protein